MLFLAERFLFLNLIFASLCFLSITLMPKEIYTSGFDFSFTPGYQKIALVPLSKSQDNNEETPVNIQNLFADSGYIPSTLMEIEPAAGPDSDDLNGGFRAIEHPAL